MRKFAEAIGRFVTAAWNTIAAFHRLLVALLERDIEQVRMDRRARRKISAKDITVGSLTADRW